MCTATAVWKTCVRIGTKSFIVYIANSHVQVPYDDWDDYIESTSTMLSLYFECWPIKLIVMKGIHHSSVDQGHHRRQLHRESTNRAYSITYSKLFDNWPCAVNSTAFLSSAIPKWYSLVQSLQGDSHGMADKRRWNGTIVLSASTYTSSFVSSFRNPQEHNST